jgi:formate hydrogenlyase subunit 3/multisubunit Na+/H+ antiporter MnhD subunit
VSPLTPLLILLVGTAGVLFGLLPRFRYTGLAAVAAGAGALAALLLLALSLPARATLSSWAPLTMFGVPLALEANPLGWLFALAVLVATLATLITGLARPGGRRVGTRAAMLLLALASLISIFSDNLLTRVVAWALVDVIYFLALIFLAEGDDLEPQAVLNLSVNSAGTLLAVAAAMLISRTSDTLALRDAALTPQSTLVITLAAVFRLGLFPLHLGLPTEVSIGQGLGTMLRLIPAAVALETVSRLAAFGFAEPVRPWLTVFAAAAALVGAVQLWTTNNPRQGIAYIVIAQSGVALLAGLWGGGQAALALTATALALVLGGALIFLAHGYDENRRWPTLLPLIGVAAMAGAPLTVGFMGVGTLYGSLAAAGGAAWLVLVVVLAAQAVLVAGLLHVVLWPDQPVEAEPAVVATYYGGLSAPAILLVLTALAASVIAGALGVPGIGVFGLAGIRSVSAIILVVLTLGAGIALWRFDAVVRGRLGGLTELPLASLGRLGWLYRSTWVVVRAVAAAVNQLAWVLEGEGALLWTLVAGILVWLLWKG